MENTDGKISKGEPRFEETTKLLKKLKEALSDPETLEKVKSDFTAVFEELGLNSDNAENLYKEIADTLKTGDNLEGIENKIFEKLNLVEAGEGKNLVENLSQKLSERARIIASQVAPHLKDIKGKVLDFGTGDGQVAQFLKDDLKLQIEGADIKNYKAPGVFVPIKIFDGDHLDVPDNSYEAALLTNVLHHELDNEKIIYELSRIVSKRLVILETIPDGKTEEEMQGDFDRTFMNDYLYNRLFHHADIPVPGTYETPINWIARFAKYGWRVNFEKDLGFDQPIIRDRHYLLVFEREVNS